MQSLIPKFFAAALAAIVGVGAIGGPSRPVIREVLSKPNSRMRLAFGRVWLRINLDATRSAGEVVGPLFEIVK